MKSIMVLAAVVALGAGAAYRLRGAEAQHSLPVATFRNEKDIALFERRAEEDPWSAADRAQLAGLYLQRGRETGDYEDYRRAERAGRSALALRSWRNRKARLALASSLLAQHRFVEARAAAEQLVADEPAAIGGRALLGEIVLELGDRQLARDMYALAEKAYRTNPSPLHGSGPSSASTMADIFPKPCVRSRLKYRYARTSSATSFSPWHTTKQVGRSRR